ncbi:catechol 2,3-dioxygenase [Corynebacterium mycetoides]|uniref:Catechol 2,3-dioxygenase n=1 Tax=Corynebacterium mycetoides TaxID=38302 RepID=A0A1G9MHI1_9CORY|nr:VOC family protein [Corynebacterium mycetoides]SDL73736.1 catechol 2,3-dioxygenase [Corynebacterium mycetoides]
MFTQTPHPDSLVKRNPDDLLPADLSMGAVELLVRDMDAMVRFYNQGVGLDVLQQGGDATALGLSGTDLVTLRREPNLPVPSRNDAGLFHTAVLFPTPELLAASVASVASAYPRSFTGSADHLYSEAFYFDDPEGNGVELYVDRPRDQWVKEDSGLYALATDPLDPNAFLSRHAPDSPVALGGTLGHVHLQVGNIDAARDFYVTTLGFEVRGELSSALFVSAGGYHHHIALNTWNSLGAGPRAAALGLGRVDIDVQRDDDLAALEARLKDHGLATRNDGRTLSFEDPWNTVIRVTSAAAS